MFGEILLHKLLPLQGIRFLTESNFIDGIMNILLYDCFVFMHITCFCKKFYYMLWQLTVVALKH